VHVRRSQIGANQAINAVKRIFTNYFPPFLFFDLSPDQNKKTDKIKEIKHKINAMYGCLHLKCSWNKLNSFLQKTLAKLPEEKIQRSEYKKIIMLQQLKKYRTLGFTIFI